MVVNSSVERESSRAMLITGLISMVSCLAVMLKFHKNRNLWDSKHNRLIFYITLSDFLCALGVSFGLTEDGSPLCQVQMILTNAPPLWSIFWTVVVAYNVVQLLRRPVLRSVEAASSESISWKLHAAIWTFPIVVTFGALTTNTFGCFPKHDVCWCYIGERPDSPYWGTKFWTILSFYLWMWLALLLFVCLFGYAMYKFRSDRSADARVRRLLVQKLIGYPLIIIVCWFGATYIDIYLLIHNGRGRVYQKSVYLLLICMPGLQGACIALLFFTVKGHTMNEDSLSKNRVRSSKIFDKVMRSLRIFGILLEKRSNNSENSKSLSHTLDKKATRTLRDAPFATGPFDAWNGNPNAVAPCNENPSEAAREFNPAKANRQENQPVVGSPGQAHPLPRNTVNALPRPIVAPRPIPESVWAALAESSGLGRGNDIN